jgi:hypothetical protein
MGMSLGRNGRYSRLSVLSIMHSAMHLISSGTVDAGVRIGLAASTCST